MNTHINVYAYASRLPAVGALPLMMARLLRSIERAVRLRRDRATLSEMPDHLLKDIGISRSNIISVARFQMATTRRQR